MDKYIKDEVNKREQWLKELTETAAGLSADQEKAIR